MKKLIYLLTLIAPANTLFSSTPTVNWTQLSRSSFGTGTTGLTISKPGNYLLTESVTANGGNTTNVILIDADGVTLDLGNNTINANATTGLVINIAGHKDVTIQNGTIESAAGKSLGIAALSNNVLVQNIKITESVDTAITISASNVTLQNLTLVGLFDNDQAIQIDDSLNTITVQNCSLSNYQSSAITVDTACSGLLFDTVTMNTVGHGITALSFNNSIIRNCTCTDTTANAGHGFSFANANSILIENTNVSGITGTATTARGIMLNTCTNVQLTNVNASASTGASEGMGFYVFNSNGLMFEMCTAMNNLAQDAGSSSYGFFCTGSTGISFNTCLASKNEAQLNASGFHYVSSRAITTTNCTASANKSLGAGATSLACGFYSSGGTSNKWTDCTSTGQAVTATSSNTGYGAAGWYLTNEQQGSLLNCTAQGNGALANHSGSAAGFYLDGTVNTDCKYVQLNTCSAIANCTSATSGTTAFGFRDTATDTTNIVINCYAANNTDSAAIPITTNYYADLTVGGVVPANYPKVEANMDGLLGLANRPEFFNVSITP